MTQKHGSLESIGILKSLIFLPYLSALSRRPGRSLDDDFRKENIFLDICCITMHFMSATLSMKL